MSELIIEPIENYGLSINVERKNKPMFSKIGVVGAGKEGRNIINMAATLDHIECRAWALIPDDTPRNLRLAHRLCNSTRGDESWSPLLLAATA